ncbi:MAG TPA: glycosyltransferase [Methanobacterium sp.]|jgi:CMP-N-acetylneuraminic acid synthetase|nr:MAG: acylneuraminate cytidylyltransferase [Methanobacterium sp.]HOI39875.1 glycosyltransferase [Methanobacterium sp.]HOI71017.1 glycosyltransferase [Methanobacterium sp.]
MNILAIIPARGGSKGIIRKNLRLLNQKPLISYQIANAVNSQFITDVVVTSDSNEILDYSSNFPVHLRKRPADLADDKTTLDPVVNDATLYMEQEKDTEYDVVVTLQPTSPLLSLKTLDGAIENFIQEDIETMLPVVDATHLQWKEENNYVLPDYEERVNRQWLPRKYKETGAFLITHREYVQEDSRFADNVNIFLLDELEGLDVDTDIDFLIAETLIKRLKIALVVNGNRDVGMGHIHRALTIADGFIGHDIKFITYSSEPVSVELIKDGGYRVIETEKDLLTDVVDADIVINDILDTSKDYVNRLKDAGCFVVNFEDLDEGSSYAHLVFNALYEKTNPQSNHRFGYEYECLKEQFFLYQPVKFRDSPRVLFVTFGGVDQNNLTSRILNIAPRLLEESSLEKIIVVLGGEYSHELEIPPDLDSIVEVHRKVENMPELMSQADIAVTSNGRTIYELASMAIPTISIAQNDRETLHLFARYHKGINYLGISCTVQDDDLASSIIQLASNTDLRCKMYEELSEASVVIRKGLTRIINEITSEYWKWKYDQEYQRDEAG